MGADDKAPKPRQCEPMPGLPSCPPPRLQPLLHSAFYRFVRIADVSQLAAQLRALAPPGQLQGSIVLAPEGISGAVAGPADAVAGFEAALQQPPVLGAALQGMAFKRSACAAPPFGRFKVSVKPEIVALGLTADMALPDETDASHLAPLAWRALLARDDVVLLDNRNHFEFRLGHFRGAVDPGVHNFRDFVAYVQQHAPYKNCFSGIFKGYNT
jgi:UPF0176 protein